MLTIIVTSLLYFSSTTSIARDGRARNPGACSDPTQGARCNNAPLTTSSPTIDTIQLTNIGFSPQGFEQTIDASPLHPGTMIDSGSFTSGGAWGIDIAWATSDYWSTDTGLTSPLCTSGLPPGLVDNSGSYAGNGSYYSGFWLCRNSFFNGFQLMKSTGDKNNFVLTNGLLWRNNDTFTDVQDANTVYPCSGFEDSPSLIGDKGPGSTWVYTAIVILFSSAPNSMNCDKGQGLAFEASSDGANTWPIRTAFRGTVNGTSLASMWHHPFASTTNSTLYLTGFDTGLACSPFGVAVYKSTDHGSSWTHSCVTNGPLFAGDATVAAYGTSVVYSVFSYFFQNVSISDTHLFASKSTDAGRTWSTPVRIDDSPDTMTSQVWRVVAHVSPEGRLDVAWLDHRNTQGNYTRADLYYGYSTDGSSFASPIRLTPQGPYNYCRFFNPGNTSCQPSNDFFGLTETNNSTVVSFFRSSTFYGGLFTYGLYITSIVFPHPPATVDFTSSPTSPDVGSTVTFTSTVQGGTAPYSYMWTFGDGGTSTAANPAYMYKIAGSFTVTLTVTDSSNPHQTVSSSHAIAVVAGLSADFTFLPSSPTTGQTVTFASSVTGGTGPYMYRWAFGDGGTDTAANPTHAYATSGTFTVTLTVTGPSASAQTATASQAVTVILTSPADFETSLSISSVSIKAGTSDISTITISPIYGFADTVRLTGTVSPPGPTVSFSESSILGGSGMSYITIDVSSSVAAGDYTVTLTATSGNLSHSKQIPVTVTSASTQPVSPVRIFGIDPAIFYSTLAGIIIVISAGVGWALRMRKPKTTLSTNNS